MGADERPLSGASTPLDYDKPLPSLRTGLDEPWDGRRGADIRQRHHAPANSYDDKPLPPINDLHNAPVQGPRKPNMSLFSLFSRPKVQKLRGYAESGLSTPMPRNDANAPRADLSEGLQSPKPELPRSTSSMSFRTHKTHGSSNNVKHPTARRTSQNQRTLNYDPPPLFQAFARSTKNGLVEISTASPETVMAKSRAKRIGALQMPTEGTPRGSSDTSRSGDAMRLGRLASRASGSIYATHVDVERKILVLVTTGHLLQYSEYGPSGRLPEKVLVLGESSAAYASDLISGRPYVAQISQEVDGDGIPVPPAGSLFSRVGIKNSATKKMISNVLLVLPDGDELNTWLSAVRKQIEELGGPPSNQVNNTELCSHKRPRTSVSGAQQQDEAPMQRYHIRRALSTSEPPVTQSTDTDVSPIEPPPIVEPTPHTRMKSRTSIEEAEAFGDILAAGASYTKPPSSVGEAEAEAEAFGNMLAAGASYTRPGSTRGRSPSDAPSVNSSVAQSVDNLRLSSLRNSVRMSTNTNVTGWTSRTNSLTSEHGVNKQSMDNSIDAYGSRGPYRNLSSYGSGPSGKRRSAMPVMPSTQMPASASNDLTLQTKLAAPKIPEPTEDSPVTGWNSSALTALPPIEPRGKVLTSRQSMPLLTEEETKHDSSFVAPPPLSDSGERPQSIVGDLPSTSHWTTKLSPAKRTSRIQPLPTEKQMQRMSSAPSLRTASATPASRATRRKSSQPFTLPLKVNPSGSANSASWQNSRQMHSKPIQHSPDSSEPETPVPRIVKLQAQITPKEGDHCSASQEDNIPHNPPGPAAAIPTKTPSPPSTSHSAPAPTTKRLSIFPPAQPPLDTKTLTANRIRPPSLTIPANNNMNNPQKRPISIQIRTTSSPAPFLSSLPQNHQPHSASPQSAGTTRSFTPPIRSLKPSRPGPNAFRSRTSLPVLDLGIPVVGLGPPAPPPSAPLPKPPALGGSSRPASPLPPRTPRGGEVQG